MCFLGRGGCGYQTQKKARKRKTENKPKPLKKVLGPDIPENPFSIILCYDVVKVATLKEKDI